tara:strand:- start:76 stop:603 length:528 start_codon:yes stop_codon:yes gene_type:complete
MKESKDIGLGLKNYWEVVCYDSNGAEKWREYNKNKVMTAGADYLLDVAFKSGTPLTTWFIGLKNTGTAVIADTMASHSSWIEIVHTTYYTGPRQTLTLGAITLDGSTSTVDNSSSKATFSILGTATVAGAFVVNNNASSSATTGTLYGVVDFGSSRAVINGDTLEVTVTLTAAST